MATDVNRQGTIVGYASYKTGNPDNFTSTPYLFLYRGGVLSVIGGFPKLSVNRLSINDRGEVVGTRNHFDGTSPEAVVLNDNKFLALEDLVLDAPGVALHSAQDINNRGQIVATGYNASGQLKSYVLTPVATVDITTRAQIVTASHLAIKGRATGKVTRIAYRIGKNGKSSRWKTVTGKRQWHFAIALKRVKNVISVYARTARGDLSTDQVTIIRK